WGETFCRERKKRLEKIKENCYRNGGRGDKQYSGDGEACDRTDTSNKGLFADLESSSCPKSCGLYKRWIEKKKTEYEKQKKEYSEQQKKCVNGSNNHRNGFCGTVTTSTTAGDFLKTLTSCSKKDSESAQDEIKFDDDKTFKHTDYCDPCSKFIVKCENGKCSNGDGTKVNCNGNNKTITAEDINGSTADIGMLVSDDSPNGFDGDLDECEKADIFNGIKKEQWKCRNVCGYVVCKLEKVNEKHIIQIRALIKRWLEYLFEDYNRIRKKLNHCMNSSEQTICTNGCVEQWINLKKQEWENIKTRFIEQYNYNDTEMKSSFRSFLETLITQIAAIIDKGNHNGLVKLVKSVKCNCGNNSQNGKEGEDNDLVKCLLDKLGEKAKTCEQKHQNSDKTEKPCQESSPDDEEPLEEEEEYTVGKEKVGNKAPAFCEIKKIKEEVKEEEKCEAATAPPKEPAQPALDTESKTKANEEAKPPEPVKPAQPLPQPPSPVPPNQSDQPTNSISDILSSTIPFGIAIALTSIVFLFLKKNKLYIKAQYI
ncbi:hypothetical protein PFNF54_04827, partial [Plasmodium falciparum NF54]